jgi:hypothetical protein
MELLHTDGRADGRKQRRDETYRRFSQICERP